MKRIKAIFTVFAFVAALGATFATQYVESTTITGWEYVQADDECVSHTGLDCHIATTGTPCTIAGGIEMRQENDANTECGNVLRKDVP